MSTISPGVPGASAKQRDDGLPPRDPLVQRQWHVVSRSRLLVAEHDDEPDAAALDPPALGDRGVRPVRRRDGRRRLRRRRGIGGALAYEGTGRVPISLQSDGDLMPFPAALWTMARYDVPLLSVVHNNGALYNSTQHRMNLAAYRGRDDSYERALVGTGLNPVPDYASLAELFGVTGYGPVEEPDELAPVLERAWDDVTD
ncbi:thiamine pyrophosphate-dependent enzyme [Salinigranum sp. GCM10025319]|uniref:thiamine pyrophosphate-dependent enzyme n=1 Tax=Salinigranum sp. GCM10025319 TaxID=3252687 RepID=UPI003606A626